MDLKGKYDSIKFTYQNEEVTSKPYVVRNSRKYWQNQATKHKEKTEKQKKYNNCKDNEEKIKH